MPRVFALLLMILLLLVASCAGPEVVEVLPTAVAELPTVAVTLAPPTSTSTAVPTATELPSATPTELPTVTVRPTSTATATPTAAPLPTVTVTTTATAVTALPLGNIYMLWDSQPHRTLGEHDPRQTLYRAQFISSQEWVLEPILENIIGNSAYALSPDQTRLAFSMVEDANNDGHVSDLSSRGGLDFYRLYLYDFTDGVTQRLNLEQQPFGLTWLDSETIITKDLWVASTNQFPSYLLHSLQNIRWASVSPNKKFIAVNYMLPEPSVALIDLATGEILFEVPNWQSHTWPPQLWSPNEQWLVIQGFEGELLFIDIPHQRGEVHQYDGDFVDWYIDNDSNNSPMLILVNEHRIWAQSLITSEEEAIFNTSKTISSRPRWMPNHNIFMFSLYDEGLVEVVYYDIEFQQLSTLLTYTPSDYGTTFDIPRGINFYTWSPDGQWGLFGVPIMEAGDLIAMELYLLHIGSQQVFKLLETQFTLDLLVIYWISD